MNTGKEDGVSAVTIRVNGEAYDVVVEDRWSLADTLRDQLGLTGTHLGCEQGVCGACTVLLDGQPVRACLLLAAQCDGAEVTTAEADDDEFVSEARSRLVAENGLQCGFCTPGFVALVAGLRRLEWSGTEAELAEVLSASVCRCTGYTGIIRAAAQVLDVRS